MIKKPSITKNKSWLCIACGKDFDNYDNYKKHAASHAKPDTVKKEVKQEVKQEMPEMVPVSKPTTKPIKLKYVYEGHCEICSSVVNTIEVDIGNDHFCIAYCVRCGKQVAQSKVAKL